MSNVLISCDSKYYKNWGISLIRSLRQCVPWINITVIIINAEEKNEVFGVNYYYDNIEISNNESRIAYYQAARFLKCCDIFPNNELVMTVDCDSICTREFTTDQFNNIAKNINFFKHPFKDRLLAGIVTFGEDPKFRKRFKELLMSEPYEKWKYGRDQLVIGMLAAEFDYGLLGDDWMSMGKEETGVFYTLKGNQKNTDIYIKRYIRLSKTLRKE